jgi:hypothetical protein
VDGEIWAGVQLVATVVVGGCLALSGAAKLRIPAAVDETFEALRVPVILSHRLARRAFPWIEILIGTAVLLAPGGVWWPAMAAACLLLLVLLILVIGVVRRLDAVSCACFGRQQPVTGRTVARNATLLVLALIAIATPLASPAPAVTAAVESPSLLIATVMASAVTLLLTFWSVGGAFEPPADAERDAGSELPIPALAVRERDTDVALAALVAGGPALLVFVKPGCSACRKVTARFSDGERLEGRVMVRFIEQGEDEMSPAGVGLRDPDGSVLRVLGLNRAPSALLLAANGNIPADPVYGAEEVFALTDAIEAAVRAGRLKPGSLDVAESANLNGDNTSPPETSPIR